MRRQLIISILLAFASSLLMAQPESSKFGKVSDEELEMTVYDADSSASAVILFDVGTSEIRYNTSKDDFEVVFNRHVRIKILTKDGFDWADFSIPLYYSHGSSERLSRLRGFTFYKQDGKTEKEKLETSSVIEEKSTDNISYKKFTMPRVTVGSVIDLNYDVTSDFLFNLQDWNFQYMIPVIYSEYKTIIPEYLSYRQHLSGYEHVGIKSSTASRSIMYTYRVDAQAQVLGVARNPTRQGKIDYRADIATYTAKNVPALPNESFVDNRNNYRTSVEFELFSTQFPGSSYKQYSSTWEMIVEKLVEHANFGGQLSGTRYLRDEVMQLKNDSLSVEQQLTSVYTFIKSKISWNQRYRLFASDGARQAYRNGTGNSAELNFNLINALRELGFDAMPVALSTRSNGRIFPHQITMSRFNHVIVMVKNNGKVYLMDATSVFPNPFILPSECLNEKGRIIDVANNDWVALDKAGTSRSLTMIESTLDENGSLLGSVNAIHSNYRAAYFYRQTNTDKKLDDFISDLEKRYQNAEINLEKAALDENNPDQFASNYTFITEEPAMLAGDMVYLNPMVGFEFDLNPFRQHTRKLPVNFTYPQEIQYTNKIRIPEGYALEDAPANLNIALPGGDCRFLFAATVMNEEVLLNARLMINRTIFPPEEFENMKAFFDAVIKKQEEKLVLKKI